MSKPNPDHISNRLQQSSSLYLRQHADNAVAWQPWDEQALALARKRDMPILLSVGYSACHWCHVMAHESFEDAVTAELMNRLFINIKVDREQRPDLDKLYQLSHQLLTRRGGGWPLTVFLEPENLTPFFAGTYFPPQPRHGMPAFSELLLKLRDWFDQNRDQAIDQGSRLLEAVASIQQGSAAERTADATALNAALHQLEQRFDAEHGGLGGAPKFPQAPQLALLQGLAQHGAGKAGTMLEFSLRKMALSGLRDHLDGGFFRYTVDHDWTIPHFEKMLYDNALLLPLYAESSAQGGNALFAETASGVVDWLVQHMRSDVGGFYASIDADADGHEGGFHVWQPDEVRALTDERTYALLAARFGLDQPANFEGTHWHLKCREDDALSDSERTAVNQALQTLFQARAQRVPPATDTKLLTSWNALAIDGLARAGLAMQREEWVDLAVDAAQCVRDRLWIDGRLYAVYADDQAEFPAYLDDHAFLLKALLSVLRARWSEATLSFARDVAEAMLDLFEDPQHGGFYFTASDQPAPMARLRSVQDDATPNGNGVAALALEQLGHLLAEPRYLQAAHATLCGIREDQLQHPLAHASLLLALQQHLQVPALVVICGVSEADSEAWKNAANSIDRVHSYLLPQGAAHPAGINSGEDQKPAAYVCEGLRCLPPVHSTEGLREQLLTMANQDA